MGVKDLGFRELGLGLGIIGRGDLTTTVLPNSFVEFWGVLDKEKLEIRASEFQQFLGKKRKHLKLCYMLKFGGVFMIVRTTWKLIFDIAYILKINPLNPKP